jgi:phytoene desaturase
MSARISIIGSGFAGLSAACDLASKGYSVDLFEKNGQTGGRARSFRAEGFVFDMGPSWYWMPDVFDTFFARYGKKVSEYYQLVRLDPSYRVFFQNGPLDIPAGRENLKKTFEEIEPGAGVKLDSFLEEARIKYQTGMGQFVWKPSLSVMEFAQVKLLRESLRLQLFSTMSAHIRRYFKSPEIIRLLEFPVLFLGAKPSKTPALYSLMNYADIDLGTWYPMGGMCRIAEAMTQLAEELGVKVHTNAPVDRIEVHDGKATGLWIRNSFYESDAMVGAADYQHVETRLLKKEERSYSDEYWESRVMSPSSLIFYLGINKKVSGLLHHNLFFDESFDDHAGYIYDSPAWPEKPLFYVCVNSKTDAAAAPEGMENLFVLIPVAPGMSSSEELRNKYLEIVLSRIQKHTGEDLRDHIVYKRSFAHEEFISEYHSFKGNAYGLANTLRQTAFLKPRMRSKKVKNLFYAGQLTVPGPGVPPSLISGVVAAGEIHKHIVAAYAITL